MSKKPPSVIRKPLYVNPYEECDSYNTCPYSDVKYVLDKNSLEYQRGKVEAKTYGPYDSFYEEFGKGEYEECNKLFGLVQYDLSGPISNMNWILWRSTIEFNGGNPVMNPSGFGLARNVLMDFVDNEYTTPFHTYVDCIGKEFIQQFSCKGEQKKKYKICSNCNREKQCEPEFPEEEKAENPDVQTDELSDTDLPNLNVPCSMGEVCETGYIIELKKKSDGIFDFILLVNSVDIEEIRYIFLGDELLYSSIHKIAHPFIGILDFELVNKSMSRRKFINEVGYRDFTYLYFRNFDFSKFKNRTNFRVIFRTPHLTDSDTLKEFDKVEDRFYSHQGLTKQFVGWRLSNAAGDSTYNVLKDLKYSRNIFNYVFNDVRYFFYGENNYSIINNNNLYLTASNTTIEINARDTKEIDKLIIKYIPDSDICVTKEYIIESAKLDGTTINSDNNGLTKTSNEDTYYVNYNTKESKLPLIAERIMDLKNSENQNTIKFGTAGIHPITDNFYNAVMQKNTVKFKLDKVRINPYTVNMIFEGKDITFLQKQRVNLQLQDSLPVLPNTPIGIRDKFNVQLIEDDIEIKFLEGPTFEYLNFDQYFSFGWFLRVGIIPNPNIEFPVKLEIPIKNQHFYVNAPLVLGTVVEVHDCGSRPFYGGFENNNTGSYIIIDFTEDVTPHLKQYPRIVDMAESHVQNSFSVQRSIFQARTYEDLGNNRIKFIDILVGKNLSEIREPNVGEQVILYTKDSIVEMFVTNNDKYTTLSPPTELLQIKYFETLYDVPVNWYPARTLSDRNGYQESNYIPLLSQIGVKYFDKTGAFYLYDLSKTACTDKNLVSTDGGRAYPLRQGFSGGDPIFKIIDKDFGYYHTNGLNFLTIHSNGQTHDHYSLVHNGNAYPISQLHLVQILQHNDKYQNQLKDLIKYIRFSHDNFLFRTFTNLPNNLFIYVPMIIFSHNRLTDVSNIIHVSESSLFNDYYSYSINYDLMFIDGSLPFPSYLYPSAAGKNYLIDVLLPYVTDVNHQDYYVSFVFFKILKEERNNIRSVITKIIKDNDTSRYKIFSPLNKVVSLRPNGPADVVAQKYDYRINEEYERVRAFFAQFENDKYTKQLEYG